MSSVSCSPEPALWRASGNAHSPACSPPPVSCDGWKPVELEALAKCSGEQGLPPGRGE